MRRRQKRPCWTPAASRLQPLPRRHLQCGRWLPSDLLTHLGNPLWYSRLQPAGTLHLHLAWSIAPLSSAALLSWHGRLPAVSTLCTTDITQVTKFGLPGNSPAAGREELGSCEGLPACCLVMSCKPLSRTPLTGKIQIATTAECLSWAP